MALRILVEVDKSLFGKNKLWVKRWVICPKCNHKEWYYSIWPQKCVMCDFAMHNIKGISTNLNDRLEFHRNPLYN